MTQIIMIKSVNLFLWQIILILSIPWKNVKYIFIILKYKVTLYYKKQIKNLVNNNIY